MPTLHRAVLQVFADYHQFYVQDGGISPAAPTDWSDHDVATRVKVADHVVVICPVRNMSVPVIVEVVSAEPHFTFEGLDHIVRCSVDLPTGKLQVHECTGGEVLWLTIESGTYSVLVFFAGLGLLSENGLEGEDCYRVTLWPGAKCPTTVLKVWPSDGAGK